MPWSSLDHALHPHPLSKKSEVKSFPYSLSLSHHAPSPSHTQLPLQHLEPIPVKHSQQHFQLNAPISIFRSVHLISSYLCDSAASKAFVIQASITMYRSGLVICKKNRVWCVKDPPHKSFLYEGVCPFVCMHHDPGFYSCTGDWVNEIACLPREARVPRGLKRDHTLLPGHVTPGYVRKPETQCPGDFSSRPKTILLKIHQLTRKRLNAGQLLQREEHFTSQNC